ncbi:hypothetical protein E4U11_003207 [Claviceps purpurea]|nr:hypothetical protein E4U11_003207 [Claviceps purpurea]
MNLPLSCPRCRAFRLQLGSQSPRALPRRTFTAHKRPPSAPKPIIDYKAIRRDPELYERTCKQRNYAPLAQHPSRIVELHQKCLQLQRQVRSDQVWANLLRRYLTNRTKFLADTATDSHDNTKKLREMSPEQVKAAARDVKTKIAEFEKAEGEALAEIHALALEMPNLTSETTPPGDEHEVRSYINESPLPPNTNPGTTPHPWRSHDDIGTELGVLDFATAATTSGWGWYYMLGGAAQLEQALVQYALSMATKHGWTQVSPPTMVYSHIGSACGFRPRDTHGEQQVYTVAQGHEDAARGVPELCLSGTSEIPLAGMKVSCTIPAKDLPLKCVAVSRCYRAEAGARGADTRGLYRVHEFTKVELFAWTAPESAASETVYQQILALQTEILRSLGLYCRVLEMPARDLGASATRKVDIEAWFPGRQKLPSAGWGEVTSASTCTDYQTRRLATRTEFNGAKAFPWTCNGTALAVPRVVAALLEYGWDEETKTVVIPPVLRPWMGGRERFGRVGELESE